MPKLPTLSVAHEVRSIAQSLIQEHHAHLGAANLLYVFTDQKRKRCDRVRLGSAAKMTALQRFLASGMDSVVDGPDFVILIDSNEWSTLGIPARKALVDHELSHCALFVKREINGWTGWWRWTPEMDPPQQVEETHWGMRGHDIEEFSDVLYRHGFWKSDPEEQRFRSIALQLVMPKDGVAKKEPVHA